MLVKIWVHTSPRGAQPRELVLPPGRGEDLLKGAHVEPGLGAEPRKGHLTSSRCHKASVASYPVQSLSN